MTDRVSMPSTIELERRPGPSRRGLLAAGMAAACLSLAPRLVAATDGGEIAWGAALPLSGAFGPAGEDGRRGLETYVNHLNVAGGIAGRPVRLSVHDSAYMPDRAIAAYRQSVQGSSGTLAFLGDSAGFARMIGPDLAKDRRALVACTSFASALADRTRYPLQFIPGPTYADMIRLILEYLAEVRPAGSRDYRVVLVHSSTEFGRDPLDAAAESAKALGLSLAAVIETKVAGVRTRDVITAIVKAKPDAVIFHGYIASVWPEVIRGAAERGLDAIFFGTYWAMDPAGLAGLGEAGHRYFGVMPYRYWWERDESAMLGTMARKTGSERESSHFIQAWLVGMIFAEAIRRTIEAGQPLDADHMKAAVDSLEDWDSGGLIGLPVRLVDNRIPIGRIYRGNPATLRFEPVSHWQRLG